MFSLTDSRDEMQKAVRENIYWGALRLNVCRDLRACTSGFSNDESDVICRVCVSLSVHHDFDNSRSPIDDFPHTFLHFVARNGETVLWVVKEARVCRGIPKLAAERSDYPAGKQHCRSVNQTKSDGFIEVCIEMVSRISNVS